MTTALGLTYRAFICDLDGVVYRGAGAVPHAVESLEQMRATGRMVAYATNNAARPPADVGGHLRSLGISVDDRYVLNSSQAGARRVAQLVPAGSRVLAVGGPGVALALEENGLVVVRAHEITAAKAAGAAPEPVAAVLQGFGPDVSWHDLSQAAFAIQGGALWVATNDDTTLPLAEGLAPGNGSLVGAVRNSVEVDPVVVGKPYAPLYQFCADVLGTGPEVTLALGDRLNTDIAGAVTCGMDSLWVLTGVSSATDVALADPRERPTYQAMDLRALTEPYQGAEAIRSRPGAWAAACGPARCEWDERGLTLGSGGSANERLRAFVALIWAARDGGAQISAAQIEPAAQAWLAGARS